MRNEEAERLKAAIRKHRDAKGHDRCWENDLELYAVLDEPLPESPELPCRDEFLRRCGEYFEEQNMTHLVCCPNCGCPAPNQIGSVLCIQCGQEFTRRGLVKIG